MTALAVQSPVAFSLTTLAVSVLNMKRIVDWNKWIQNQELSNIEEVQSSFEPFSWRKQSFSKNQNAIGRHHSHSKNISVSDQKENQQLPNTSSPSINFTMDSPVELRINTNNKPDETDLHLSQKSVTITRRSSKPSRHESVQIATSQTRKRQRDRYINYRYRLEESQLYSLIVSSNGIECYGTNCQPSVFNTSHRCRPISPEKDIDANEKSPLMNDQDIKHNISYISLTNLSNIIDHEPNVSRRESYSRSTSNILVHKPSIFLADIFNKMTHEQRAKSIAQLTKLHENLRQSNTLAIIDRLQQTTSLPNLSKKPTKLHSVTSLLSERTTENIIQTENKTSPTSPTEQKYIDENMILSHINHEISSHERTTDLNEEITSACIDQNVDTPAHISKSSDKQIISSPIKLVSLPTLDPLSERKLSRENIQTMHINDPPATTSTMSSPIIHSSIINSSPRFIKTSKSNTNADIEKTKTSQSTHFLDTDLNEQSLKSNLNLFKTSKIEQTNTQFSNLSNPIEAKTIASSSNSTLNSIPVKKQQSNNETKSETISKEKNNQLNQETNLEKNNDLSSKLSVKQKSITSNEKQMPLSYLHFQSSNDENEIENSLNDVTDHFSQQDTIIPNLSPDKSLDIISKKSNKTKRTLPLLKKIDEISQHSKSSHSHLKKPILLITSSVIATNKETSSMTPIKLEVTPLSPIDDGDTSIITRITTASTNLTITDDDDEQSKLINEQLKRSSLGLARDSLELLRNNTPHHGNNDEQLIPHINIDSTPCKRKSVLKSRLDSSDNLPTPELISYVAIDEVKGDKRLMEKQIRRRSLTVGGGTVISCTSPKPKRDSLILIQERYSGFMTPNSGCYHLSGSDSRHVEFIREPGDTITPALHIGRGTKSKYPTNKLMSPSFSNDHYHDHHFSSHTFDSSERSKSEMSLMGDQQQFEIGTRPRRPSLDSVSRHRTPQTPLISATTSFIDTDGIEEEKVCLNKSDYDEMVRIIMTPLSEKKKKHPSKSKFESNIESCINNRLTTFQNLILLIILIFFYIFIFIKSQYWQEHNQK